MSDYFAALMRASGLFSPAGTPTFEAPLELGADATVPAAPSTPVSRPFTSQALRTAIPDTRVPTPEAPASQPMQVDLAREPGRPDETPRPGNTAQLHDLALRQHTPESPLPQNIEEHEHQGRPSSVNDPVQAALRWIAADPQLAAPLEQPSRHGARPPQKSEGQPSPPHPEHATTRAQPGSMPAPVANAATIVPSSSAFGAPISAAEPAIPEIQPEAPGRSMEESVEISIGAIHLRVEAPAPQTVARPATQPVRNQPSATPTAPGRSGLSRRALRRL